MLFRYLLHLGLISLLIILYYKYSKNYLIQLSAKLVFRLRLSRHFPQADIKGAIELCLIASSHVLFAMMLWYFFGNKFANVSLSYKCVALYFSYGVLLGIGCMGVSTLLCQVLMQVCNIFQYQSFDQWMVLSRGGWMKHHMQSMEIFPIAVSLSILAMQVGAEETIFRGILIPYFMPFGVVAALSTACVLFVGMQALLTHRWQTALFPMVGATVMGVVHGLLYIRMPMLWPLIIAHISFFIFSVI